MMDVRDLGMDQRAGLYLAVDRISRRKMEAIVITQITRRDRDDSLVASLSGDRGYEGTLVMDDTGIWRERG